MRIHKTKNISLTQYPNKERTLYNKSDVINVKCNYFWVRTQCQTSQTCKLFERTHTPEGLIKTLLLETITKNIQRDKPEETESLSLWDEVALITLKRVSNPLALEYKGFQKHCILKINEAICMSSYK